MSKHYPEYGTSLFLKSEGTKLLDNKCYGAIMSTVITVLHQLESAEHPASNLKGTGGSFTRHKVARLRISGSI